MPKSYRIRTSVGNSTQTDKTIKVQVDQDFDFLEILSLKLTQSDVYRSFCSDYGVVVGRVIANGGYGVPNAKVSVFVPIDAVDQNDPVISALYPYKNVTDKNEDGYRYNLLPYTPSYEGHAATGTFPTREDVLTRTEVLQIYEKYYKYTVKTNESGDYMIVGVPLGNQQVILDVDLSDMGCFSLRPTDLIRMNLGNPKQFDGNQFKSSPDLASLPQIVNQRKSISVSSFWGTGDVCDVGITRVDFDLRDSNVTIEPTATFMGSIMTSNDSVMLKNNCKPSSEQGDLCGMVAGPGRILAVRQTINVNANNEPILEQYQLEQGGKVIDENGAFVVDVPMNLDYVTTNEFGELIFSDNPSVGIPTKGKYRFKVKTDEGEKEVSAIQTSNSIVGPSLLNLSAFNPKGSLLRGNFLVPNIKEYGWTGNVDPATKSNETTIFSPIFGDNTKLIETRTFTSSDFGSGGRALLIKSITGEYKSITYKINNVVDNSKWVDLPNGNETLEITVEKKTTTTVVNGVVIETPQTITLNFDDYDYNFSLFQRSYAFSLNWDDYPNKTAAISCQDFFYEFNYNKVYTTAQLIDEYRKGTNRSRFLSIKEILDRSCDSEVNKFPINDGVRNFDLLYFIVSILFQIFGITGSLIIIIYHIVKFLWNNFAPIILVLLAAYAASNIYWLTIDLANAFIKSTLTFGATLLDVAPTIGKIVLNGILIAGITLLYNKIRKFKFPSFNLPMITYPDCSTCDCNTTGDNNFAIDTTGNGDINSSPLADVTLSGVYVSFPENNNDDDELLRIKKNAGFGQVMAGNSVVETKNFARTPFYTNTLNEYFWSKNELPIPERINLYNTKGHYFANLPGGGSNRIKVYPNYTGNTEFYEDQPMVFLVDANAITTFQTGNLITFVNLSQTYDVNILSASTVQNGLNNYSVTGTTISSGTTSLNISYANPNGSGTITKPFNIYQTLYNGAASYTFPSDIEYHQVVTATTVGEIQNIVESKLKTDTPVTPTIDRDLFNSSFYKRIIDGQMTVYFDDVKDENNNAQRDNSTVRPLQLIENYKNLGVIILMKGVDPYTTRQRTKIDISKPFGLLEGSMIVESDYKLNIPIAPNLNLLRHDSLTNNNVSLFNPSYVFTPSTGNGTFKYSAYTTHNHSLFSNFDSDHDSNDTTVGVTSTNNAIGTQINGYYAAGSSVPSGAWAGPNTYVGGRNGYFANEYVEGGGLMTRRCKGFENPPINWCGAGSVTYSSNVYSTGITLNMSTSSKIIMRSDRLPRSSSFDNRFVFSQNKAFSVFAISDNGASTEIAGDVTSNSDYSTNSSVDFEQSYGTGTTSVMSSFSCPTIVPLGAYTQSAGGGMTVKPKTDSVYYTGGDTDYPIITNGCYTLVAKDLAIGDDLKSFAEWKSRFLMGFAICRNVFGMTFTNNWINGVLYMPGFQNDKIYPGIEVTNPTYVYCREKIVFKEENNSFFYRSSPFNGNTGNFVGMLNSQVEDNFGNVRFLGNPTTVVDLGPKDNIIKNVCAQPEFQGYVADRLKATSFQGVSDLMQYFIVSRLSNADFLDRLLSLGDSSISELFSRPAQKIDGDFAQLNSINNEIGVVPFSPESYSESQLFYGATPKPVVGVFFSSDTVTRDYISPGREIFIDTPTKFGFNTFGHKTQVVPMYRWEIKQNGTNPSMFGGEENNWITSGTIYTAPYQGIDRLNDSTYFPSFVKHPTGQRPGYIYSSLESKDSSGNVTGFTYDGFFKLPDNRIVVGAPYHFYFGLKKGKTAFDIFLTKNLINI
jgi:hypothetical protein